MQSLGKARDKELIFGGCCAFAAISWHGANHSRGRPAKSYRPLWVIFCRAHHQQARHLDIQQRTRRRTIGATDPGQSRHFASTAALVIGWRGSLASNTRHKASSLRDRFGPLWALGGAVAAW